MVENKQNPAMTEMTDEELDMVAGGSKTYAYYIVQDGDNLQKIGNRYNVNWRAIFNLNKPVIGPDPNLLIPGMRLRIPQ